MGNRWPPKHVRAELSLMWLDTDLSNINIRPFQGTHTMTTYMYQGFVDTEALLCCVCGGELIDGWSVRDRGWRIATTYPKKILGHNEVWRATPSCGMFLDRPISV